MDRPLGRKELDMIEQLTLSLFLYHCSTWEAKKIFEGENIRNRLNSLQIILKSERLK